MMRLRFLLIAVGAIVSSLIAMADAQAVTRRALDFSQLEGWTDDRHGDALRAFTRSCDLIKGTRFIRAAEWRDVCARARLTGLRNAKSFFEEHFLPVLATGPGRSLTTGYYEPVLEGSRTRTGPYVYPLYAPPPDLPRKQPWLTRAQIEDGALRGRGLEIVWLKDPVEAFFLHVQGSGRIVLPNGDFLRVGFAGRNNHRYSSVGQHLLSKGVLPRNQASAEKIAHWVSNNPKEGRAALNHNKSYIFFRILDHDLAFGPVGAMGIPLTPNRSIAVDRRYVPLGAPVWMETTTTDGPMRRLTIAQDVGAAIKGIQRADIFFGWGPEAYRVASRQRNGVRLVQLWPRAAALRLPR